MTYPPARYTGEGGEASATYRPTSAAHDLTYPNGGTADYLATGPRPTASSACTDGT